MLSCSMAFWTLRFTFDTTFNSIPMSLAQSCVGQAVLQWARAFALGYLAAMFLFCWASGDFGRFRPSDDA